MNKQEFIDNIVCHIENLCLEELLECYDVTTQVHKLVDVMTEENDIQWSKHDEDEPTSVTTNNEEVE